MVFLEQNPVRYKIVVDNKRLQKVNNSEYIYCEISYANEKFIQQKLANFLKCWEF